MKRLLLFVFLLLQTHVALVYAEDFTPTPTTIDYSLPYPGLLPDQPLYFLKAARDSIQSFFISNPIKKADFDLLQADKRMEASWLLVQKSEKIPLAVSTLSKAQNYFEQAVMKAREAQKQGMNVHDLVKRLALANSKHQELLQMIQEKAGTQNKEKFRKEAERIQQLGKEVNALEPHP